MNVNDSFPSNYLKASDLQGRALVVRISHVEVEAIGRNKEQKPVVYFTGKTKGIVLNKTNARKICEIAGSSETDDWVDVAICIYPTETEFAGETVECIRVKAPAKAGAKKAAPVAPPPPPVEEVMDDEIPF